MHYSLTKDTGDNAESQDLCGCRGRGCKIPCRLCLIHCSDLHNPILTEDMRDSDAYKKTLEDAFHLFCKKAKGYDLLPAEEEKLKFCDNLSLYPLKLAFMDLESPFEGHSVYQYFRPDLLHTLMGRLKTWAFSTIVCIGQIGLKYKGIYRENFSTLDHAIKNFYSRHSLPFVFEKLSGITQFCLAGTDSRKGLTTAGFGSIDHQKMPAIVIEMLICKLIFNCYNNLFNFLFK